jgi:hypothetical protein
MLCLQETPRPWWRYVTTWDFVRTFEATASIWWKSDDGTTGRPDPESSPRRLQTKWRAASDERISA